MLNFYCECRCGCCKEVVRPFDICSACKGGDHQHLNLNLTVIRNCESSEGGSQVYDRSTCSFVCELTCQDFGRERTQF